MTTKCSWCEKVYHYVSKHEKLCNQCFAKYVEKREFIGQKKNYHRMIPLRKKSGRCVSPTIRTLRKS